MEKMKIEIWSDIACPYCYIGKRLMETAIEQFPYSDELEVVWHSYELNHSLAKKPLGIPFFKYVADQHGVTEEVQKKQMSGLVDLAKSVGLEYNLDKLVVTNTSDALRLSKLARQFNLASEVEEVLFKAYFTDGKNISDKDTLVRLGVEVGMSEDVIVKMLLSEDFIEEIQQDMRYSEEKLGLDLIPFYLLNGSQIIQGSLPLEKYSEALNVAYKEWKEKGVGNKIKDDRIGGKACSADGVCSL